MHLNGFSSASSPSESQRLIDKNCETLKARTEKLQKRWEKNCETIRNQTVQSSIKSRNNKKPSLVIRQLLCRVIKDTTLINWQKSKSFSRTLDACVWYLIRKLCYQLGTIYLWTKILRKKTQRRNYFRRMEKVDGEWHKYFFLSRFFSLSGGIFRETY